MKILQSAGKSHDLTLFVTWRMRKSPRLHEGLVRKIIEVRFATLAVFALGGNHPGNCCEIWVWPGLRDFKNIADRSSKLRLQSPLN